LVAEVSAAEPDAASSFELAKAEQPHPQTAQAHSPKTLRHMSGNQRLRRRDRRGVFELLRLQSSAPPLKRAALPPGIDRADAWSWYRSLSKQAYPSCKRVSILRAGSWRRHGECDSARPCLTR